MRIIAILVIYLQALIQGIGFTTIPAAANFLTDQQGFAFTISQYGSLFIPMIVGAVMASFVGGVLAKRYTIKNVLLTAGVLNVIAMSLIALSEWQIDTPSFSYPLLLNAMAFLGAGFGANITALNPFAVHYFPDRASTALTALHSFLGIGTAIGPLSLNLFFAYNWWWGDPSWIALAYFILLLLAWGFLPKKAPISESQADPSSQHISLLSLFVAIAVLYGFTETTFGNWATLFLHQEKDLSQIAANDALSIFWGSLTIGRIITTFLTLKIPPRWIYRLLPVIILVSLVAIQMIFSVSSALIAFALAGLGCSAYLPLTVSFGVQNFLKNPSFASGLLISTYMIGYGLSAEGIGIFHQLGLVTLTSIYFWLGIPVLCLALLCYVGTIKKGTSS